MYYISVLYWCLFISLTDADKVVDMKKLIFWLQNIFLGETKSEFFYQHEEQRFEFEAENQKVKFLTSNKAS